MLPISFVLVQVLQHLRAVKELVLVGVHGVEVPPQLLCIGHPVAVVMTLVITFQGQNHLYLYQDCFLEFSMNQLMMNSRSRFLSFSKQAAVRGGNFTFRMPLFYNQIQSGKLQQDYEIIGVFEGNVYRMENVRKL